MDQVRAHWTRPTMRPMRADHAVRHNAAVGALIGLAVGDALSHQDPLPPVVDGGSTPAHEWTQIAATSFDNAEKMLNGAPLDISVTPAAAVAAAIALADPDLPPPLLADPDAVLVCELVRNGLLGQALVDPQRATSSNLRSALHAVHSSTTFADGVAAAQPAARPLTGAIAGAVWGPAAIPARWSTVLSGAVGERTYHRRQLTRLAERLMKQDAPRPPEPRRSLGPREVAPGLWLSNLHAVPRFLADHPEGAVLSLCPTTGAFDNHQIRREFALHDAGGRRVNPLLAATVDEVLATIESFHHEGRPVLVHCHHGASRTGLVLRAWLVHSLGLSYDDATTEAQVRWPKTSTWNAAFCAEIERRCQPS